MKWLVAILAAAAAYAVPRNTPLTGATINMDRPRGIRNNNPGNIRYDGITQWQGMIGQDSAGFIVFDTPEHGIRAMVRILTNYQRVHGLNTVDGIIGRWAPSAENNTGAYVSAVSHALNVAPDQPIDVQARMKELIAAIIRHENGQQPYITATIRGGIALA